NLTLPEPLGLRVSSQGSVGIRRPLGQGAAKNSSPDCGTFGGDPSLRSSVSVCRSIAGGNSGGKANPQQKARRLGRARVSEIKRLADTCPLWRPCEAQSSSIATAS